MDGSENQIRYISFNSEFGGIDLALLPLKAVDVLSVENNGKYKTIHELKRISSNRVYNYAQTFELIRNSIPQLSDVNLLIGSLSDGAISSLNNGQMTDEMKLFDTLIDRSDPDFVVLSQRNKYNSKVKKKNEYENLFPYLKNKGYVSDFYYFHHKNFDLPIEKSTRVIICCKETNQIKIPNAIYSLPKIAYPDLKTFVNDREGYYKKGLNLSDIEVISVDNTCNPKPCKSTKLCDFKFADVVENKVVNYHLSSLGGLHRRINPNERRCKYYHIDLSKDEFVKSFENHTLNEIEESIYETPRSILFELLGYPRDWNLDLSFSVKMAEYVEYCYTPIILQHIIKVLFGVEEVNDLREKIRFIEITNGGLGIYSERLINDSDFINVGIIEDEDPAINRIVNYMWKRQQVRVYDSNSKKLPESDFIFAHIGFPISQTKHQKNFLIDLEKIIRVTSRVEPSILYLTLPCANGYPITKNKDIAIRLDALKNMGYDFIWRNVNINDFGCWQNKNYCVLIAKRFNGSKSLKLNPTTPGGDSILNNSMFVDGKGQYITRGSMTNRASHLGSEEYVIVDKKSQHNTYFSKLTTYNRGNRHIPKNSNVYDIRCSLPPLSYSDRSRTYYVLDMKLNTVKITLLDYLNSLGYLNLPLAYEVCGDRQSVIRNVVANTAPVKIFLSCKKNITRDYFQNRKKVNVVLNKEVSFEYLKRHSYLELFSPLNSYSNVLDKNEWKFIAGLELEKYNFKTRQLIDKQSSIYSSQTSLNRYFSKHRLRLVDVIFATLSGNDIYEKMKLILENVDRTSPYVVMVTLKHNNTNKKYMDTVQEKEFLSELSKKGYVVRKKDYNNIDVGLDLIGQDRVYIAVNNSLKFPSLSLTNLGGRYKFDYQDILNTCGVVDKKEYVLYDEVKFTNKLKLEVFGEMKNHKELIYKFGHEMPSLSAKDVRYALYDGKVYKIDDKAILKMIGFKKVDFVEKLSDIRLHKTLVNQSNLVLVDKLVRSIQSLLDEITKP